MPRPLQQDFFDSVAQWTSAHADWLSWIAGVSLLMLVATPVLLPVWIASLPADYFVSTHRPRPGGLLQWLRRALAWVVGSLLVVAGVLMLFLPGQGLLTLFVGLSLLPFPGKRRLMRRVLRRREVARGLQWMRRRAHKRELVLPGQPRTHGREHTPRS